MAPEAAVDDRQQSVDHHSLSTESACHPPLCPNSFPTPMVGQLQGGTGKDWRDDICYSCYSVLAETSVLHSRGRIADKQRMSKMITKSKGHVLSLTKYKRYDETCIKMMSRCDVKAWCAT